MLAGASVGVHCHVHPDAVVEFVATDKQRTDIPWLRIVRADGTHEVFARDGTAHDQPPAGEMRKMDCNDCHNRIGHAFDLPGDAPNGDWYLSVILHDHPDAPTTTEPARRPLARALFRLPVVPR